MIMDITFFLLSILGVGLFLLWFIGTLVQIIMLLLEEKGLLIFLIIGIIAGILTFLIVK